MTEQVSVHSLAEMLSAPEPDLTESTGEAEETEVLGSQTDEADYEADSDEYEEEYDESDDDEELEYYNVKVDGEELQVTLEEALAGYQRDSDYRKKTMKVAEDRKAIEARNAEIDARLQELDSFIKREEETIDWQALRRDNPELYLEKREALDEARKVQEKATAERQKQLQEQRQQFIQTEAQRLTEAMGPTWTGEQRDKDMQAADEYLKSMGVSEEEIAGIIDHRLWRMIIDASKAYKFSQTKQKVRKEVRKAPKSVKPGQKLPASERQRMKKAEAFKTAKTRGQQMDALINYIS